MKIFILNILFSILALSVVAQKASLEVHIPKIKAKGEGQIILMLFSTEDGFPAEVSKAAYTAEITEFTDQMTHVFEDLPYGTYAVSAFQDKNKNGEADRNFLGFPKEPVGASNKTSFGRPSYVKCSFKLNQTEKRIELTFLNE